MKRKRFAVEQITAMLKQAEHGVAVADLCRQQGMSEQGVFRWTKAYGGLESLADAPEKIDAWRSGYDEHRPHRSLKGLTLREFAVKAQQGPAKSRSWWSCFSGPLNQRKPHGLNGH